MATEEIREKLNKQEKENAEFIAFAFNLQQRYDISKLEEVVKLLEKQLVFLNAGFNIQINSSIQIQIEGLLKEIKK